MSLFESSAEAWHAAFATAEGVQDPFSPRIGSSTRESSMRGVREAESGKVRKAIDSLAADLHWAGMCCYAPDGKIQQTARHKLCNALWKEFQGMTPETARLSYWSTVRMTILITAVLEEGRAAANGHSVLSDACVASRMGIDRSSFSRTWAASYRHLVEYMSGKARLALTEIEPLVNEINACYRKKRA